MPYVSSERERTSWHISTHPVGLSTVRGRVLVVAVTAVDGLVALRGHPLVRHVLGVRAVVIWRWRRRWRRSGIGDLLGRGAGNGGKGDSGYDGAHSVKSIDGSSDDDVGGSSAC